MKELNITMFQADLVWENKKKNLENFAEKFNALKQASDLIILPEMFSTGFSMRPKLFAEGMDGPTMDWMKNQSRKLKADICGSFICVENKKYFNRLIWMRPDGTFSFYDKRHLFSMGKEDQHYTAGAAKLIVELKGWRICPLICYDLRFPVWSRRTIKDDYDLLVYVANWPERRILAWRSLLQARAIENQCYVAGLNRTGADNDNIHHSGDSGVFDPKGHPLGVLGADEESFCLSLKKEVLEEFRSQFPAINDADHFSINY